MNERFAYQKKILKSIIMVPISTNNYCLSVNIMRIRWLWLYVFLMLYICHPNHRSQGQTNTEQSPDHSGILVLDYQDFGPQVIAHQILGMEWWQWEPHGDPNPGTSYPIKVIVYQDISLQLVKYLYPVDPDKSKDYRYVPFQDSLQYLENEIKKDILPETTKLLSATYQKTVSHFKK